MTKVVHCKKDLYNIYIEKYKEWILNKPDLLNSLEELEGKILGCWCYPKKCHGDVLIELLNKRKKYGI